MNQSLRWLLLGSIMLNVLLGGVLIGKVVQGVQAERGTQITGIIDHASLPEEKRHVLKLKVLQLFADDTHARVQAAQARERALQALEAEPFDRQTYLRETKRMLALRHAAHVHMNEAMADIAAQLGANERKSLAAILRQPSSHPSPVQGK